jgi:two-component system response regulator MprA
MRILVVEDDPEVRDFLARVIADARWVAHVENDADAALRATRAETFDIIVLDVGLPGMDGLELCRRLRARGDATPILLLTARHGVSDRVKGLDAGADDYLPKPFAVNELLARLRALARRPAAVHDPVLRLADLELDPATRAASRGGTPIALTAREYALLEFLLRHRRRVVTRTQIVSQVWDDNFDPVANAVDVLVGRLRRKIDPAGAVPLLQTVRGAGYLLTDADVAATARKADAD